MVNQFIPYNFVADGLFNPHHLMIFQAILILFLPYHLMNIVPIILMVSVYNHFHC